MQPDILYFKYSCSSLLAIDILMIGATRLCVDCLDRWFVLNHFALLFIFTQDQSSSSLLAEHCDCWCYCTSRKGMDVLCTCSFVSSLLDAMMMVCLFLRSDVHKVTVYSWVAIVAATAKSIAFSFHPHQYEIDIPLLFWWYLCNVYGVWNTSWVRLATDILIIGATRIYMPQ